MDARRKAWLALAGIAIVLVAGVGWWAFAPRLTETREDAAPADATTLLAGVFQDGAPLHTTRGNVTLLRDAEGYLLHFEDYDATPGPDVYFYLVQNVNATTDADVEEAGHRIDTDSPSGQATIRGDFNVRLRQDIDPTAYAGIAVWCERYDVLFGSAALTAT